MLSLHQVDLACLQESKLSSPSPTILKELGGSWLKHWEVLEASGSRGGILVGWNDDVFQMLSSRVDSFSISAQLVNRRDGFK